MSALLLLALLLQPTAAHTAATAPPATEAASPAAEAASHAGTPARHDQAQGGEEGLGDVIMHHVTDQPVFGLPSKHLLYFVLSALLVIVGTRAAVLSYRGGLVPHGLGAAVESLVLFVRDEIAEPNVGHGDGRRFTPLLCSFFFFILVAALVGLVPLPGYHDGHWSFAATTATGNLAVTMGLALVSFAAQQYAGISKYGVVGHFRNLVPPGLPLFLLPIMIPVEIISMFTKPFALMIRLFANMLAGHMVVTTLILLISLMAQIHWLGGVAMAPVSILLSVFILLLEVLVAFIQAYIFTLLSAIFIGMYAHPAH
jgi:F-type H+-transporting ATPase subunit a